MNNIRALIILITIVFFSSCNKEEENTEIDIGHTVTFSVAQSRSTQEGTFDAGDAIGIFAYEPKSQQMYYQNSKYVFDGKVFVPATDADNIRVSSGTDYDFYVYYPYNSANTEITSISHVIPDQSNKEDWQAADFMTSTYTDPVVDYNITLNFKHRYATLQVIVTDNEGINQAQIANVQSASHFDLMKGTYTTDKTLSTKGMYLYATEGNISKFRITLPVQSISESNPITLSQGGQNSLEMKATATVQLEEGKIQDYSLGYKKTISINNYDTGGSVSGAGQYVLGSTCIVSASPKSGYTFVGWYENGQLVSSSADYSFDVLKDRTLETRYSSYGNWTVSVSANPTTLEALGGTSTISSVASRTLYINGKSSSTETGTPTISLSGSANGFTLSGNKVTAGVNESSTPRTVTVKATYSGVSNTCTITQKGGNLTTGDWVITVSASPEIIAAAGGTSTIAAKAVRDVYLDGQKVKTETGTPDISGSANGFTLSGHTVTASNNITAAERSITVTASLDGKKNSCVIKQQAGVQTLGNWSEWTNNSLKITAQPSVLPATGGTSKLTASVNRQRSRTVYWNGIATTTETAREDADVTTSTSFSGSSSGFSVSAASVTASENTSSSLRSIVVTGRYAGITNTVTITQNAGTMNEEYVFELSSGQQINLVESSGGTISYTVSSYVIRTVNGKESREDVDYSVSVNVNWITAGKTSALVKDNPNTTQRNGVITFKQNGSNKNFTITVTQKKKNSVDIEN